MNEITAQEEIITFFKILVDPNRLCIAGLLGVEALTVTQLAERVKLPPMAVLNHLEKLSAAGITSEKDGRYTLQRKHLEALARDSLAGLRLPPKVDEFDGDAYDQKVIRDFSLPDGSLKSLPAQPKKFQAVLHYVGRVFEPGVEYPEKQVNEMLKRFNADTASLRRGLVDNGTLQRERGIYWKSGTVSA
jgi:hypothetical protein